MRSVPTVWRKHFAAFLSGALGCGLVLSLQPGGPLSAEERALLRHVRLVEIEDGSGARHKTVRFEGVNVQIVNGLGATNGDPDHPADEDDCITNGVGNLIVGYNEPVGGPTQRTGSHNLVVGLGHSYTGVGGQVVGYGNGILAPYASVVGGSGNQAR